MKKALAFVISTLAFHQTARAGDELLSRVERNHTPNEPGYIRSEVEQMKNRATRRPLKQFLFPSPTGRGPG